jgi:hypothetical protein
MQVMSTPVRQFRRVSLSHKQAKVQRLQQGIHWDFSMFDQHFGNGRGLIVPG